MYFLLSENSQYRKIIIPPAKLARPEFLNAGKKADFSLSKCSPKRGHLHPTPTLTQNLVRLLGMVSALIKI
jgi:hypothetical protein